MKSFWLLTIFVLVQNPIQSLDLKNFIVPKFILKMIKQKADKVLEMAGEGTACAKDLKKVVNEALFMKRWALEMLDASAKIPSGLLAGNIFMAGNFDQCLNVNVYKNESNIRGQYCTVILTPHKNSQDTDFFTIGNLKDFLDIKTSTQTKEVLKQFKLSFGLCIPQTCSIENVQKLWNYVEKTFKVPFHVHFIDKMCSSKQKPVAPLEVDIYIKAFLGVYICIVLLSTWYDVFIHQHIEADQLSPWIAFSVYTNAKKLISLKETKHNIYLHAISGIKVLNMLWIIYGHRVMFNLFSGVTNLIYTDTEWRYEVFTSFTFSGSFAVDTFLTLSGLLLSYGILNYHQASGSKKVPVLLLYLYRLLRLSPALLAVQLFYISIYKQLSSGPMWPYVATKNSLSCHKLWYTTLFFVNNFINIDYQCIEQSWYLAVDTQLFLISPILLKGIIKNPFKTSLACICMSLLSGLYTFYITVRDSYGAIFFEGSKEYHMQVYQPTIVRMPPWLIGFVFGYIIYKYKDMKVPKVTKIFAWSSVFLTKIGLILVHLVFLRNKDYNAINAASFNAFARQLWAIATCLMLFLCTTDRDGIINRFLSLPIFQIIVRLSYSVYLTHLGVLMYFIGGKKHPTYFTNVLNIHDFMGDLFFVFVVSFVWCVAFESPFLAIAKYFFKTKLELESPKSKMLKQKKTNKNKSKLLVCLYQYDDGTTENKKES